MIELVRGSAAERLLRDPAFVEQWTALHASCEWATAFQSPRFLGVWHEHYRSQFELIIVREVDGAGRLTGLLTLARSPGDGLLVGAGSIHAEYQAWLSSAGGSDAFLLGALGRLEREFPGGRLRLSYVPGATPLGWIKDARWASRAFVRHAQRALVDTDNAEVNGRLGKRKTRWHLGQLERLGPLTFTRVTDGAEFDACMREGADLCDFRQAAAHGVMPFRGDPIKLPFHRALLEETDLVHLTTLRAGSRLLSVQLNLYSTPDSVLLSVLGHAPIAARHSPSHLHMLMLVRHLRENGVPLFDLSPEGAYKDRIATRHDTTHVVQVELSAVSAMRVRVARRAVAAGARAMERAGLPRAAVKARAAEFRARLGAVGVTSLPGKLWRRVSLAARDDVELRVYTMPVERARALRGEPFMRCDDIGDVLAFRRIGGGLPTTHEFMRVAMQRLSHGEHVYTRVEDEVLVHYGWLVERQERALLSEVGLEQRLPPNSAVLYDYYTAPAWRGRGFYRRSLTQMLGDAAAIPGTAQVVISVRADNAPSRRVIESVGFDYQFSCFRRTRFGKVKRWSDAPPELVDPVAPPDAAPQMQGAAEAG